MGGQGNPLLGLDCYLYLWWCNMLALPRVREARRGRVKFEVEDEDLKKLENYLVELLGLGC